ncbi:hypothetical protein [Micromonospora sp. NBC_01813]|uniref:hypothetical protein n=1 Tax=Micromonospora sp. NBC_01813 TaxID=2975988 RepID=UPI002DDA3685|nr:hypothetical protein [Micromonospora sp. NBC_01813]WSA10823.1 hypothetical protein OG958_08595 [Micromonospora sp. NBC_01813]
MAADGRDLYAWLRRDGAGTLVHLCWGDGRRHSTVTNWAANAWESTASVPGAQFEVLPLTSRTAIATVALTPGHAWLLAFDLETSDGSRMTFTTMVKT